MLDNSGYYSLILSNRADVDQRTYFEDYGEAVRVCRTCHIKFGPMYRCKCTNVMCESCVDWSRSDVHVLDLNQNKRTKNKQRYVMQTIKFNSYNCNVCKRVVGYRL